MLMYYTILSTFVLQVKDLEDWGDVLVISTHNKSNWTSFPYRLHDSIVDSFTKNMLNQPLCHPVMMNIT